MAHSLRGKDRVNFIITVCDLNIYLGCICALTCEKNATVEEYIWKTLNNYFEPRKIKFYDKSSGIWKENIKKLNSKDITYYLLACNVMGNMKAIKWYIYNHEVDKAIIIQLAKNMNEEQLVDLIYTLYRSSQNWDKIRGIGSTKSLFLYKNDPRIKKILSGLWYKDRDAFIQLAYDTGWLGDLGKKARKGNRIFIECLVGANKLLLTIELIEEVLCDLESDESSYDTLLKLVNKSQGIIASFDIKKFTLDNLVTNVLLENPNMNHETVLASIYSGFDILVYMEKGNDNKIRVTGIKEITNQDQKNIFIYANNTFSFNKHNNNTYKKLKNMGINTLDDIFGA